MNYCVECGHALALKYLENEGDIPYCDNCQAFRFPTFSTAVSMIMFNKEQDKILLIQQYGRKDFILVAGYINKGENAEHAVAREVAEELGMQVSDIRYNRSQFHEQSGTLMLNFACTACDEGLEGMTKEVDYAEWLPIEKARASIKPDSLAQAFLEDYLGSRMS